MDEWRPIPGFARYAVSSSGQVRSHAKRWTTDRILRSYPCAGGYHQVRLDSHRQHLVHRLVMLAFAGPCPEGQEVNHKNGVTKDNRLSNLEYVTKSQNLLHRFRVLNRRVTSDSRRKMRESHLGDRSHNAKRPSLKTVALLAEIGWSYRKIGQFIGCSASTVKHIIHGRHWSQRTPAMPAKELHA